MNDYCFLKTGGASDDTEPVVKSSIQNATYANVNVRRI